MIESKKRKPGPRSDIDWEAAEKLYRIGALSTKEIAKQQGIAYSTLRKRIEDHQWVQDLTETVRIATKSALLEDAKQRAAELGIEIGTKSALDQVSAVKAQVGENVIAIRSHTHAAERLKAIAFGMMDELEEVSAGRGLIAEEISKLAEDNPARAAFVANATSLKTRVETADKIGALVTKFVAIERQARGLEDAKSSDDSYEAKFMAVIRAKRKNENEA